MSTGNINMFLRPFKFYPFLYLYISIYSIPFYIFINHLIISVFISSLPAVYFYYIPYVPLVSMSIQFHLFVFLIFLVLYSLSFCLYFLSFYYIIQFHLFVFHLLLLYSLSFCLYSVSFHYSFIHSTQLY